MFVTESRLSDWTDYNERFIINMTMIVKFYPSVMWTNPSADNILWYKLKKLFTIKKALVTFF